MAERPNTLVCTFDQQCPRMSAHEAHIWMLGVLKIQEQTVRMVQFDGTKRQVYVQFHSCESVREIIQLTQGHAEYKHASGEISIVQIGTAGLGYKRIRVANLPLEVTEEALQRMLAPYGKVLGIRNEVWPASYVYRVFNGVRQVEIVLNKHVPSHLYVDGLRALISYDGQPTTCYGCGQVGHLFSACPSRRVNRPVTTGATRHTYADAVAQPPEQINHDTTWISIEDTQTGQTPEQSRQIPTEQPLNDPEEREETGKCRATAPSLEDQAPVKERRQTGERHVPPPAEVQPLEPRTKQEKTCTAVAQAEATNNSSCKGKRETAPRGGSTRAGEQGGVGEEETQETDMTQSTVDESTEETSSTSKRSRKLPTRSRKKRTATLLGRTEA
jgi:hypothetical protein